MAFSAVFPRVLRPPFGPVPAPAAGGVDWSAWFDHFWQAKGAASQAASYLDLVGSADLTEGVAPTWSSGAGLSFNGSTQYLKFGLTPQPNSGYGNVTWSVMVQYASFTATGVLDKLIGSSAGVAGFGIGKYYPTCLFVSGGYLSYGTFPSSGNIAIAGDVAYLNGSSVGTCSGDWLDSISEMYLGGANYGESLTEPANVTIIAVGIKASTMSSGDVAAASAAMAAL